MDIPFVMDHLENFSAGGPFVSGTVITITWVSSTVDSPCGPYGYAVSAGTDAEDLGETHYTADGSGGTFTRTLTADAAWVVWTSFTSGFCSSGHLTTVSVSPGTLGTYCNYGTETIGAGTFLQYLTPGLIDLALARIGRPDLAPWFTAFWFSVVNVQLLCGTGQPEWPSDIGLADILTWDATPPWTKPGPKIQQALDSLLWGYFCQCKAGPIGAPPPLVYGDPVPPAIDTHTPPVLSFDCDNTDLCTLLNQLTMAVSAIGRRMDLLSVTVDLIQRQKVPFSYISGALHSGLTGAGTFDVAAILGLSVNASAIPSTLSASMAPVNSYFRLGELSLGTDDGWERRIVVTHDPHLVLEIGGHITKVAYLFEAGVTADVLELVREP